MTAKHVMVDLETLGRRAGCRVLSIGAVEFSADGLGKEFYVVLNHADQTGLHVDPDTEAWWAKQSAQARQVFTDPTVCDTRTGVSGFDDFLADVGSWRQLRVWGNGASFDNAIMHALYAALGRTRTPWEFWNDRCYRTLKAMFKGIEAPARQGTYHNALDDAKTQAAHAVKILNEAMLWTSV